MSAKKKAMQPAYRAVVAKAKADQIEERGCTYCTKCLHPSIVEPHHPEGRIGPRILIIKLVCPACHAVIHSNARQARIDGWLK